jgi:hypothetical protein
MSRSFLKSTAKRILTSHLRDTNVRPVALALIMVASVALGERKPTSEFQRTLAVINAEPVVLNIEIISGDLEVLYSRDGQVSIAGFAQADGDSELDDNYFSASLTLDQAGNRITLRHSDPGAVQGKVKVRYRIDVPYRTEVVCIVNRGKQSIRGVLGPVTAKAGIGDIKASYISKGLQAEVESGNIDLQVIGEHVEARTNKGNITGERLAQGIDARTGDGDVSLIVVGPSTALVEKGNGRIEVGGAWGALTCSTEGGDLHVQAVPHGYWKLNSASGVIRLDLPPVANFDLDISDDSGEIQIERDDLSTPSSDAHRVSQSVGGGGKRIEVHTVNGRITIR